MIVEVVVSCEVECRPLLRVMLVVVVVVVVVVVHDGQNQGLRLKRVQHSTI